jgi:hypothetical protein
MTTSRRPWIATGAVFVLVLIILAAFRQAPSTTTSSRYSKILNGLSHDKDELVSHIDNRTLGVSFASLAEVTSTYSNMPRSFRKFS